MITQTNPPGPKSNSSDVIKDMSPHSNIPAPSFEDDEFDIHGPQVALALPGRPEQDKINNHQGAVGPVLQYHGHPGYADASYYQQQQWMHPGEYNQMSYHQYHPQHYQNNHQSHNHYQPQQNYVYSNNQYQHQHHDEMYMSQHAVGQLNPASNVGVPHGPGRSPSGSHSNSTPSPLSQTDLADDQFTDNKRPLPHDSLAVTQTAAKKPKPSRRKKKRDPNEPQKPVSAYALFFRDRQASIKGRNPNLSFGEVSKLVASMWDNLDADSKAHYKKRTEMAKKEYLRQLAAYRATIVSKGHGEDMYGYMGYPGGYHVDNGHTGVGQNIPPHPHPVHHQLAHVQHHPGQGANTFVTSSQDYLSQHQQTAHGTEISTGNQAGIPSLPVLGGSTGGKSDVPRDAAGHVSTTVVTSGYLAQQPGQQPVNGNHPYTQYDNGGYNNTTYRAPAPHDRNHNMMPGPTGECARPGCRNSVNKAADGTESTYCSSECVVGQCRDAYQGWEQQQNSVRPPTQHQSQPQQQQPIVK